MCQRDNKPTIEQTTAEGHQQVFNALRNSCTNKSIRLGICEILYRSIKDSVVFPNETSTRR